MSVVSTACPNDGQFVLIVACEDGTPVDPGSLELRINERATAG